MREIEIEIEMKIEMKIERVKENNRGTSHGKHLMKKGSLSLVGRYPFGRAHRSRPIRPANSLFSPLPHCESGGAQILEMVR